VTDPSPAQSSCTIQTRPSIDVEVSCTDSDGTSPIQISGTVTNDGNVPLTGVDVVVTVNANLTNLFPLTGISLGVGESEPFSIPYDGLAPGQCSSFTALATGTPDPDCGEADVSDSDTTDSECCVPQVGEGCTPGYWKNHEYAWDGVSDASNPNDVAPEAGFEFDTLFFKWQDTAHTILNPNGTGFFDLAPGDVDPVFAASAGYPNGYPLTLTMDQALHLGGGNPHKMIRHGIAALLNLAAGLDYNLPDSCTRAGNGTCSDAAEIKEEIEARIINRKYAPFASDLASANQDGDCPCNVTGCP
jgi:hypothetical protein